MTEKVQIGLSIGNSRYHWAWFLNTKLQSSWDTEYLLPDRYSGLFPIDLQAVINQDLIELANIPIYLISVVPNQTALWEELPQVQLITLTDIPLLNLYPTLGIDRALALLGAGETYGYPVLVIDGGTALTITGIDDRRQLIGGAILPGLRLQLRSLTTDTAALPTIELPAQMPPRWSNNTSEAIASGVLHTINSGIKDFVEDWQRLYPHNQIVFTGGDGELLSRYLSMNLVGGEVCPTEDRVIFDRNLIFYGLSAILF
jgi:type III pantothenate kinase